MIIENKKGKYGENDRIILFTSTDREYKKLERREPVSIFKLGLLVNQIAFNELETRNGFKRNLLKKGEQLFFEEAIKESIEMAKNNINWAEKHNWDKVKDWCSRYKLKIEEIEKELKRTFQVGLDEFE